MIFNTHSDLRGKHSYLAASKPSWSNYDDEKFDRVYLASLAAARGDRLHAIAHDLIRERIKLPRTQKTLNMYVNDAIGYRMVPEQPLFYSEFAFGTADALQFDKGLLRVHDLKTGVTPAKITQLEIYCAYFCLEYRVKPFEIEMEMRIYQNDEVQIFAADPDVIFHIMEKIKHFDKRIREMREEAIL